MEGAPMPQAALEPQAERTSFSVTRPPMPVPLMESMSPGLVGHLCALACPGPTEPLHASWTRPGPMPAGPVDP